MSIFLCRDSSHAELFTRFLEAQGCNVKRVRSIGELASVAERSKPSAVFIDPSLVNMADVRTALDKVGVVAEIECIDDYPDFTDDEPPHGTANAVITPLDRG